MLYRKIYNKPNNYKELIIKYLKKIISVYVIWSLIYFIPFYYSEPGLVRFLKFIPHLLIDGVYSQLWYMQALIIATIISTYLSKKIGIKKTLVLSSILYIFGLLLVPYFPLLSKCFKNDNFLIDIMNLFGKKIGRNGLIFGTFYFTLGGYLVKNNHTKKCHFI